MNLIAWRVDLALRWQVLKKVMKTLAGGDVAVLLEAIDGADDGRKKLLAGQLVYTYFLCGQLANWGTLWS